MSNHECFQRFTAKNGTWSWYHVWPGGRSGLMYYFDGDYEDLDDTSINFPDSGLLARLAAVARAKDLTLVAVDTPDDEDPDEGYTWWVDLKGNGRFFREFHEHIVASVPDVDASTVWLVGFSGGAEFITYNLMRKGVPGMRRGGAVIVGGGGAEGKVATKDAARACVDGTCLHWFVGEHDVTGATNPPEWSAYDAARDGQRAYRAAGFDTELHVVPGLDHDHYDTARYVAEVIPGPSPDLPPVPGPSRASGVLGALRGAIRAVGRGL